MEVIAYGIPTDYTIGEDTTIKSVRIFSKTIIRVFGLKYLCSPNEEDTIRLMAMNEKRGWSGMLGSLDCMHWKWKNCPKAWNGFIEVKFMIQPFCLRP
jgi:hypothetical protein